MVRSGGFGSVIDKWLRLGERNSLFRRIILWIERVQPLINSLSSTSCSVTSAVPSGRSGAAAARN